jgi:hypothetical protein
MAGGTVASCCISKAAPATETRMSELGGDQMVEQVAEQLPECRRAIG